MAKTTAVVEDWGNILESSDVPPLPKSEGAATPSVTNPVHLIAGAEENTARPCAPYSITVCEFLDTLSLELMHSSPRLPDVVALAYWCRKANIARFKKDFEDGRIRLGLGLILHIAPSNVPTQFAYSYVLGLLAGNANVVRLPSKEYPQVDTICSVLNRLLGRKEYSEIRARTQMVRYGPFDEITERYSYLCRARVIWGGDKTVAHIRKIPAAPRCVDIVFPDRYSICFIDGRRLSELDPKATRRLAERFYNDSYFMDQNACSSPHLVIWFGKITQSARANFWNAVHDVVVAKKYELLLVHAVDKYALFCHDAILLNCIRAIQRYGSQLTVVSLAALPQSVDTLRGRFGYFYEFDTENLSKIIPIVTPKFQTLTYFGIMKETLLSFVCDNGLTGIDRIVPIGNALDMNVIWDGVDIVKSLSRVIDAT